MAANLVVFSVVGERQEILVEFLNCLIEILNSLNFLRILYC